LASTNLLYHFPVLFAVIEQLATTAAIQTDTTEKISAAEFRTFLAQPAIIARSLHFLFAAIATCGIVLMGYTLRMMRHKRDAADIQRVAAWGGQIALVPTLLQIPVGLWLTVVLPPQLQHTVTGGDLITTTLFLLSVAGAFALMQTLAAIAIGDAERARLIRAMVLLVAIEVLMSGVLQRLRAAALTRLPTATEPQATYSPVETSHVSQVSVREPSGG
jgi:cytochrome bd-type quinol oxidase subunit 1